MNNKSWIALFFGLACLVLLIGVISVSGNMNNAGRNNPSNPQQINQNLMNRDQKDMNMPGNTNANDILNNAPDTKITPNSILDPLTQDQQNTPNTNTSNPSTTNQ